MPKEGNEHWTKMIRCNMETAAWRSLTAYAQALYPWLKLEWKGPRANNNGSIRFSVRQAANALGANPKTAAKAFHELQAKGWIVMTSPARLGLGGQAVSPTWELTEIGMPGHQTEPRNLYRTWTYGNDFPVHKATAQNPSGKNGHANVIKLKAVN